MFCIYCNEREEGTRDHVVPKQLYPKPWPNDFVTVPACSECNKEFQMHEDYFRLALTGSLHAIQNSSVAKEVFEGPVKRALERKPKMDNAIKKDTKLYPFLSKDKKSVYFVPAYPFDKERFDIVLKKMVKGLFYIEKGRILPNSIKIKSYLDVQPWMVPEELVKVIQSQPTKEIGQGKNVFKYVKLEEMDNEDHTIWLFIFYDCFYMLLITVSSEE